MDKLSKMPNIGEVLEKKLIDVGVRTPEDLRNLGSKETFIRIKGMDNTVCLNSLCALEGAIQGIRWHYLSQSTKEDLKSFFRLQNMC